MALSAADSWVSGDLLPSTDLASDYVGMRSKPAVPHGESLAGMWVPDGFQVSLVAAEPEVSQPIGMSIEIVGTPVGWPNPITLKVAFKTATTKF